MSFSIEQIYEAAKEVETKQKEKERRKKMMEYEIRKVCKEAVQDEINNLNSEIVPKINRMVKTAIAEEMYNLEKNAVEGTIRRLLPKKEKKRNWSGGEESHLIIQFSMFLEQVALKTARSKRSVAWKINREKLVQLNM